MIASETQFVGPRRRGTLPVAMEQTVRCPADIESTVTSLMAAMGNYPFTVSDGFAVQMGVSEALNTVLATDRNLPLSKAIRVRSHVTPHFIRIQLDDVGTQNIGAQENRVSRSSDEESATPEQTGAGVFERGLNRDRGRHLMRTYMTSVEFRKQGRQIILYRARGQGAAISAPPNGYDFQI